MFVYRHICALEGPSQNLQEFQSKASSQSLPAPPFVDFVISILPRNLPTHALLYIKRRRSPALPAFAAEDRRQTSPLQLQAEPDLVCSHGSMGGENRRGDRSQFWDWSCYIQGFGFQWNECGGRGQKSGESAGGADNAEMRLIFETNVFGLFMCTNAAMDLLKEKGVNDGHIIHINSVAGHQNVPIPGMSIYTASKHAVTVMTEGLRKELADLNSGIRVTSISPGFVKTEIIAASGMKNVEEVMLCAPALDAKDIASGVVYALSVPPNVQIHDIMIKPLGEKF
ncbi:hypothetical protein J437_LFUL018547 [Ladona fulva]|uniref:Dehydrogenase/reductase SDR family member 11 n=1 Tax=Ladona fulva TaxID=123851 RepID=A0A8K0P6S4_LADFU|nr:hypothetical protein J437_LFUL018547 [Ladona fulva]